MQSLLFGVLILVVILLAGRAYVNVSPARLAQLVKRIGGAVALAVAAWLMLRGSIIAALPLIALGAWLLGKRLPFPFPGGPDDIWQPGQSSQVRTAMLEMTLEHATGATDGRVLSGQFAGRQLSALSPQELGSLLEECMLRDPQGSQLLRAYMERIGIKAEEPGWHGRPSSPGGMTVEEACDILGIKPGASQDEIHAAHRAMMKRLHPDQGGSTYLASKINEAREVLLRQTSTA